MEYMKINGFLGRAVNKLFNKAIETKVGFKPNLEILDMSMSTNEEEDEVRVTLEAVMTRTAFERIIEEATK